MGKVIKEKQDLTYLEWSRIRHSSGTAGSFLKAQSEASGRKIYYKLSNFDLLKGTVGHESVNELIVDRLLDCLGIAHLHYDLIHADIRISGKIYETYLCASENFKEPNEMKIALETFYEIEREENESPLEFCKRLGFEKQIYEMILVDFLILNRDRHGANVEVLKNKKKKTIRLAPLFDHGVSLLAPCMTEKEVKAFKVLEDKKIQSFTGSNSAYENLKQIPKNKRPKTKRLSEKDKDDIFKDLENVIGKDLKEKIWEMIWKRWCMYEDFCNQG